MGKMMTDKEKEILAIKMLNEGRTYPQITRACNISPNTLSAIKKKLTGQSPAKPMHTMAYELFRTMKPIDVIEVAIRLGIPQPEASKYYYEYLRGKGLNTLLNLITILGPKTVTELNSLHKALNRNGINPNLYRTYARNATRIDILISEQEKLDQQNMKVREEKAALEQANWLLEKDNAYLKDENEQLERENCQLKSEQQHLETVVSNSRIKIDNLQKQEMMLISKIGRLRAESDQIESKKQLEVSINTLQVNFDDRRKTLIEDLVLYVIEAIRDYGAKRMENVTIEEIIYDTGLFGGILREMLKEPTGEFLDSLIRAP